MEMTIAMAILVIMEMLTIPVIFFLLGRNEIKKEHIVKKQFLDYDMCMSIIDSQINLLIDDLVFDLEMKEIVKLPDDFMKDKIEEISSTVIERSSEILLESLNIYLDSSGISNLVFYKTKLKAIEVITHYNAKLLKK